MALRTRGRSLDSLVCNSPKPGEASLATAAVSSSESAASDIKGTSDVLFQDAAPLGDEVLRVEPLLGHGASRLAQAHALFVIVLQPHEVLEQFVQVVAAEAIHTVL